MSKEFHFIPKTQNSTSETLEETQVKAPRLLVRQENAKTNNRILRCEVSCMMSWRMRAGSTERINGTHHTLRPSENKPEAWATSSQQWVESAWRQQFSVEEQKLDRSATLTQVVSRCPERTVYPVSACKHAKNVCPWNFEIILTTHLSPAQKCFFLLLVLFYRQSRKKHFCQMAHTDSPSQTSMCLWSFSQGVSLYHYEGYTQGFQIAFSPSHKWMFPKPHPTGLW